METNIRGDSAGNSTLGDRSEAPMGVSACDRVDRVIPSIIPPRRVGLRYLRAQPARAFRSRSRGPRRPHSGAVRLVHHEIELRTNVS